MKTSDIDNLMAIHAHLDPGSDLAKSQGEAIKFLTQKTYILAGEELTSYYNNNGLAKTKEWLRENGFSVVGAMDSWSPIDGIEKYNEIVDGWYGIEHVSKEIFIELKKAAKHGEAGIKIDHAMYGGAKFPLIEAKVDGVPYLLASEVLQESMGDPDLYGEREELIDDNIFYYVDYKTWETRENMSNDDWVAYLKKQNL